MGLFLAAVVALGLAALGETNNEEAKKINDRTRTIYLECQEKGKKADALVNSKSNLVNKSLADIGEISKDFCEQVLERYLKIIDEKYQNYDLIRKYDYGFDGLVFDRELDYKTLVDNIETLNGALSPKVSKKKMVAMTAIGAIGISTVATALGGKALLPTIFGSSLLGALPIAAGGSYAIGGFLNKKKAIEEQQKMLECEAEVDHYLTKAEGFAESLTELNSYLVDSKQKIKDIMDNFCKALYSFETFTNNYLQQSGKKKINVKKLTDAERYKLGIVFLLSQAVYGSINMPMYTLKGVGLVNKETEEQIKTNHEASFKLLGMLGNE